MNWLNFIKFSICLPRVRSTIDFTSLLWLGYIDIYRLCSFSMLLCFSQYIGTLLTSVGRCFNRQNKVLKKFSYSYKKQINKVWSQNISQSLRAQSTSKMHLGDHSKDSYRYGETGANWVLIITKLSKLICWIVMSGAGIVWLGCWCCSHLIRYHFETKLSTKK